MVLHPSPLVRKLNRFHPLTEEEVRVLESACSRVVWHDPDHDIVLEGDRPCDSNLLLEGMVYRYKDLDDGERQILSFQLPGDIFDAQSFILEKMDHSIGTLTRCKVAAIPHATLLEITEDYPRIARAIWRDTLVDASIFREWIANIGTRQAFGRIAHLICETFVRLKAVDLADQNEIRWPITQAILGEATGLSTVHVNRSLQALRRNGLITLRGERLVITDWDGLVKAGQFEPGYLHLEQSNTASSRATANGASDSPL